MHSVFVLGSINQDIVGFCARQPLPGETIVGSRLERHPGGKGANQAVAAAQAGCRTRMIAAAGADAAGKEMLAFLASKNVDVSMVRTREDVATGTALILVGDDGQNSIVVIPGANATVDLEGLEALPDEGDACLAQFEVPLAAVNAAFRAARARRALTILNPSPFQAVPEDILSHTDVLIVNESEHASIRGGAANAARDDASPLARVADIVTLGKSGVLVKTRDDCLRIPGIPVQAVDTTGAGDCFAGYLAALLTEGLPIEDAARIANAAAALSVTRRGAGSSIPTRLEVDRFHAGLPPEYRKP